MSTLRLLKPLLALPVRHELASGFDSATIESIVSATFVDYESQRPQIPSETAAGGRLMVHCAALTIGLYRALVAHGVARLQARSLTAAITWRVYKKLAAVPTGLTKLPGRSTRDRVKRATDLFRRFPFSAPSYVMVDVVDEPETVAFDVRRCPVAEYFLAQGLPELCVESWCNLDIPLAEKWGAHLERSQTIVGGADHCDFRWRVRPQAQGATPDDKS